MAKVPRELTKQIETMENIISCLNDLIDSGKIKLENYGKEFLEPLSELRQKGLELRDSLEIFKTKMEQAATTQYGGANTRFAFTKKVIDGFLSSDAS